MSSLEPGLLTTDELKGSLEKVRNMIRLTMTRYMIKNNGLNFVYCRKALLYQLV